MNRRELIAQGYDQIQIEEILEGQEHGVDVSVYCDKKYWAIQMRQIRLGLEEGLPVEYYADSHFDWFQMEEIRMGLKSRVDVKLYASPMIPYEKMRQIRKGLEVGINLTLYKNVQAGILRQYRKALISKVDINPYVTQGYDAEQLDEIRIALEKGLSIEEYVTPEFVNASICEIRKGLEKRLDVSVYAKMDYSWRKMRELRYGMEHRVDVSKYSSPYYTWQQMREIRLGLEEGLDVSDYSSLIYTAAEMHKKRKELQLLKEAVVISESTVEKRKETTVLEMGELPVMVTITPDEMTAYMQIREPLGEMEPEQMLSLLHENGIVEGIRMDEIERICKTASLTGSVLIAEGTIPERGQDGYYEFFFRTKLDNKPKILEDGSVDYRNMEWFEMISKGQKIAYYHEAQPGTSGKTVTGRELPTHKGKEQPVLYGKGFQIEEDGKTYTSTVSGVVTIEDRHLEVKHLLVVKDVTLATGNINFDGDLQIDGNIGSGVKVNVTGDISISGFVEAAEICSGGKILLQRGMNASGNGYLQAEKEVVGKFFEGVKIKCKGDVDACYCLNCDIETEGRVVISSSKGSIAGGRIYAKRGVKAPFIGNRIGIPTWIKVGIDEGIWKQLAQTEEQIRTLNKELYILENACRDYQKKYPPEVRNTMNLYVKIEMAIETNDTRRQELITAKKQMEQEIRSLQNVYISAEYFIEEGVTVELNGLRWRAKRLKNAYIHLSGGRIVINTSDKLYEV